MRYAKVYTFQALREMKRTLKAQGYIVRSYREPNHGAWVIEYMVKP